MGVNAIPRKTFLKQLAMTGIALSSWESFTHAMNRNADSSEKKFVPVMITPYSENGKIDFDGLDRLIDFYLAAGVKGFFANCLSSEMYHLDESERLALTQHVVKRVRGTVPVVATGSFGNTMEERVAFAKKIYDTGIHAVILITSHYAAREESDATLLANFERMLELTGKIPLGLYECPSPYKRIITPEVFKALLETKRFIYHKDTSIDPQKVKAKLDLIRDNPLEFYDAHTANAVFSLQNGAKGMSTISGNFYPEILVWMCHNAANPQKQNDVQWLQRELEKTEPLISNGYNLSSKYFLQKRGIPLKLVSRTSGQPLTAQQKQTLDGVYHTFSGWCERLNIKPVSL